MIIFKDVKNWIDAKENKPKKAIEHGRELLYSIDVLTARHIDVFQVCFYDFETKTWYCSRNSKTTIVSGITHFQYIQEP